MLLRWSRRSWLKATLAAAGAARPLDDALATNATEKRIDTLINTR